MTRLSAQKERRCSQAPWALFLPLFLSSIFPACNKQKPITESAIDENLCAITEQENPFNKALGSKSSDCKVKDVANSPAIYAHFLGESLKSTMDFEDILNNLNGSIACAPGPFMIEKGMALDVGENLWKLESKPDYLVWHLDNREANSESMFITNQSGRPIISQTTRLKKDHHSTLILVPAKNALNPGVKYYLYLTQDAKEGSQTWIQPITISANATR